MSIIYIYHLQVFARFFFLYGLWFFRNIEEKQNLDFAISAHIAGAIGTVLLSRYIWARVYDFSFLRSRHARLLTMFLERRNSSTAFSASRDKRERKMFYDRQLIHKFMSFSWGLSLAAGICGVIVQAFGGDLSTAYAVFGVSLAQGLLQKPNLSRITASVEAEASRSLK